MARKPSPARMCAKCGVKWAQVHGHCSACWQALGHTVRRAFDRERDHVVRQRAKLEQVQRNTFTPTPRSVVVDGVEYDVVGPLT